MKRFAKVLLWIVVVVALLVGLWLGGGNLVGDSMLRGAEKRWAEAFGSMDQILKEQPDADANEPALKVETLAAALGIEISPRGLPKDRLQVLDREQKGVAATHVQIGIYIKDENARPGPIVEAPPAAVTAYLETHVQPLAELRTYLLTAETPRWDSSLSRRYSAGLPNLLGHLKIHKLLLTDALTKIRAGDSAGALEDLEASWRLNLSLASRHELMSQLIYIAAYRYQAAALRKLPSAPEVWQERLEAGSYRAGMHKAVAFEGLAGAGSASAVMDSGESALPKWMRIFTVPFIKCVIARDLDFIRPKVPEVEGKKECVEGPAASQPNESDSIISLNSLENAWMRVRRLALDQELTRKILQLKAERARTGSWPAQLPSSIEESICPDRKWVYQVSSDGAMSLSFNADLKRDDMLRIPLRYEEAAPAPKP